MAKAQASGKPGRAGKGKRRTGALAKGALPWYGGLVCGFLFAVSLPTALLVALTLAPALLVIAFDREAGRYAARPTALFSATVTIPLLPGIWVDGHTVSSAMAVVTNGGLLLSVAAAGFGGYLIARLLPVGAAITLEQRATEQAERLRQKLREIRGEWDEIQGWTPRGATQPDDDPADETMEETSTDAAPGLIRTEAGAGDARTVAPPAARGGLIPPPAAHAAAPVVAASVRPA